MPDQPSPPDSTHAVWEACLRHAGDLLDVAASAHEHQKFNIAFHLSLVALEEIGKIEIFAISKIQDERGETGAAFFERHANDHVAKLFWGFWGVGLAGRMNDRVEFDKWRELARDLHAQRLTALYVSVSGDEVGAPHAAVSPDLSFSQLQYAKSRLALTKAAEPGELSDETRPLILWLRRASESDDTRRFIYSAASMQKLRDAKGVAEWIVWMKQTVEDDEQRIRDITQTEMSRDTADATAVDRWCASVDLVSASHSIRSKALTEWNAQSRMIKLNPTGKNRTGLCVEVTLPDNIPSDRVQISLLNMVSRFTIALNISTAGLFWPYLPEHSFPVISRGRDLKHRRDFDVRAQMYSTFRLVEENEERRTLSLDDLARAGLLFSFLPMDSHSFLDDYWAGLGVLAKSDPLIRLERPAFEKLRTALDGAMSYYEPENATPVVERFPAWVHALFSAEDAEALSNTVRKDLGGEISFHDAVNMKVCFDLYVQGEVIRRFVRKNGEN